MKNTVKSNFSLRKLILTALVAGPVAILPAPLWALPSTAATNLTTSAGVSVVTAGTALNITSPDKGVLTWVNFGGGGETIASTDTLNYILPSSSASVLNLVSGANTTTINGALVSNGNVYVMNPNGIVIGSGATINTGGFYASAINEPLAASYFASTGTLSFVGTGNGVVQVSHTNANSTAPVFQALGSGNNIVLAGAGTAGGVVTTVDVGMSSIFGNLTTRSTGGNIAVASNGAVSVSGNLTVTSNGGTVDLSKAGTTASYTDTGTALGTASTLPAPVNGVLPVGTNLVTNGGTGCAPSSTVAVSFAAPSLTLVNGTTSAAQTVFGTAATGQYVTDATGKITSFTILTGGSGYTAAPAYTTLPTPANNTLAVTGNLSVTTAGGAVNSNTDNRVTVTGSSSFNTAGSASFGNVTLPNVDFSTLNLTNVGKTSVSDKVGSLTLGKGVVNATGALNDVELTVSANATSGSTISMASGANITVVPSAINTTPRISLTSTSSGITYTGVGTMTFSALSTSTTATATISGDKDITVPAYAGKGLSVTTSGGNITSSGISRTDATLTLKTTGLGDIAYNANTLNTSGTVDIRATNGKVTIGTLNGSSSTAMTIGGASSFITASGDVAIGNGTGVIGLAATGGITIQSTTGQVSISGAFAGNGTISAASNVALGSATTASKAAISGGTATMSAVRQNSTSTGTNGSGSLLSYSLSGVTSLGAGYNPNSNYDLTISAPAGGGTQATGYATTDANGRVSSVTITNPGAGYTTVPTVDINAAGANLPTNSVVANGALAITAGSGTITIPGSIVSTNSGEVSLTSAQTLSLAGNVTAPTLKLTSTGSNISQTGGSIVSSSKATIAAATTVSLEQTGNNFNQIVVTGTPGGATIADSNSIVIGGGTDAKGDLVVKAGQAAANQGVAISNPVTVYTTAVNVLNETQNLNATATTNTVAGTVTAVTLPNNTGYTPGSTVNVTFSAPPAPTTNALTITGYSNAVTTSVGSQGVIVSNGGIVKVNLPVPIGNGYTPNSTIPAADIAVAQTVGGNATAYTTNPQISATVNGNGQISGLTIIDPGTGVNPAGVQTITLPAATTAGKAYNGGMDANNANNTASGSYVVSASGTLGTLVLTNPGAGYFGANIPTATIAAATGVKATASGNANLNGATVSVGNLVGGSNYASAPTVTMANGSTATATIDAATRQVNSIYTAPTGLITLGTATTDTIKVAGNLTLSSGTPSGTVTTSATTTADNAVVSTVANSITVTGAISATNNGAAVTFGNAAPIGTTTAYNFGSVGASIGTGNLTVNSNGALALGAITANSLTAKSVSGDITNTGALILANGATLTAKDIFAPGNITLNNAGNAISGTVVVTNAKDFTLTNTRNTTVQAGSATSVGSAMTGLTSVTTSSGRDITLTTAGGGDYGVVSFNSGGNTTITDPNSVTIRNAVNSGTGTVTINAAGAINLDSGISLASSGLTTLNATGANGTITDTAAGIWVYGPATFNSSNGISLSKAGHSFGAVTLNSGVGNAGTNVDIVYTEAGTANLAGVTVNNSNATPAVTGSVSITSTNGAILQSAGAISITGVATATQSATFTAAQGVSLSRATNSFGGASSVPVTITAGADSAVTSNAALVLGNVRVLGGTFTVDTTGTATTATVGQAAGTSAFIFGNTSITTKGSAITLTNSGNNFGALTLASNSGAAVGANIALTEGGTININSVNAGQGNATVGGNITLVSENGSIVQTATGTGITGGLQASASSAINLTAANGNITLTGTNLSNGAPIKLSTNGNVAFTDTAAGATRLASGTSVAGSTTLRNTSGTATLSDISGGLLLSGAVLVDMTGAAATGNINITGSGNSFGAFQFRANTVTIAEDKTLNIAAGSLATGVANLSSLADIVTTGAGSSIFSGGATSLTLSAGGNITITNPIAVANGLTFRALGAVDLSALSMANLNGKTPTNLGAASYKAPQP